MSDWIGADDVQQQPSQIEASGPDTPSEAPIQPDGPPQPIRSSPGQNAIDGSLIEPAEPDVPDSQNLIEPSGSDVPEAAAIARPGQNQNAHPLQNTTSLLERTRAALASAGSAAASADERAMAGVHHWETVGPSWGTIASDIPHAIGAEVSNIESAAEEGYGAWQSDRASRTVAALNVLPQVAARTPAQNPDQQVALMAKDPLVSKTARTLGISPADFAAQWNQYRDYTDDQRATLAQQAQAKLTKAQQLEQSGSAQRRATFASEQQWQPKDVAGNPISAWTLKGLAFHLATGAPDTVAIAATSLAGAALGGAPGGLAAGGTTALALMAPQQYAGIQNKIDGRLNQLKMQAANATTPAQRAQALQSATDLSTNRDKIALTATVLYGVSDIAGSLPVASVLSKVPGGRAVLNRIVGAALSKVIPGRIAGFAVANGAAGLVQGAIQKGVDTGIIGERQSLSDALKDIAYSGVISAITGAGIGAVHEAAVGPIGEPLDRGRALGEQVMRSYQPDQPAKLPAPGADSAPSGAAPAEVPPQAPASDDQAANFPVENQGSPAAARTSFQSKMAAAQDAASRAQNRSDIQLEERDGEHHVVVDGESVASFASKPAAQEVVAQARKLVRTAPAAAQEAATPAQPSAVPPATTSAFAAPVPPAAASNATHADFEGRTAAIQSAAAQATQRSDVQLEESDGEFHVTVSGKPVASFTSKANAQQAVAQARKVVGTAPVASATTAQPIAARAPRGSSAHPITQLPGHAAYESAPKQPVQLVVRPDDASLARERGHPHAAYHMLRAFARALPGNAYHLDGDQFVIQAQSRADAEQKLEAIRDGLARTQYTVQLPDGEQVPVQAVTFSHGIGANLYEAEHAAGSAVDGHSGSGPTVNAGNGAGTAIDAGDGTRSALNAEHGPGTNADVQGAGDGREDREREVAAGIGAAGARARPAAAGRSAPSGVLGHELTHTAPTAPSATSRHPITRVPDKHAYAAAAKKPVQLVVRPGDVDVAREVGDQAAEHRILSMVAHALPAQDSFHLDGDRFVVQAADQVDAQQKLEHIRNGLGGTQYKIRMPDGEQITGRGVDLSHGIGATLEEAERARSPLPAESAGEAAEAGRQDRERQATAGNRGAGSQARAAASEQLSGPTATVLGQEVTHAEPTAARAEAGNYRKPAIDWNGLRLRVENLPGSERAFQHPDGTPGTRTMRDAYGYVQSTRSADGEGLDVFMGEHPEAKHVYVIDQLKPDGAFDEHKALVGYRTQAQAEHAYRRNYQSDWRGMGAITELSPGAFKHWVEHGDLTKPLALAPKGKSTNVAYIQHGPELVEHAERAGWAEVGGKLLRAADTGGLKPGAIGRTKWLPREAWYALLQRAAPLPKNMDGEATRAAVSKAIAGEKLTAAERRHLDELLAIVRTRALSARELEKLSDEELAEYHARMRDLHGRVGEQLKLYGGRMPTAEAKPAGGTQPDLFGDRREIANQLERVRAEMQRRERNAPAAETATEPDLFNNAGKQGDIEQVLAENGKPEHGQDAYRRRALELELSHGAEKITPAFAARPDTTSADVRMGLRAIRGLIAARGLRSGATVLGDRIPREFAEAGSAELVGQRVRGPIELAQLAQVYRDPRFETLRAILVKGDRVTHEIAVSSRLPGAASFNVREGRNSRDGYGLLKQAMREHGADSYYLLHNHPSGRSSPSDADVEFTKVVAAVQYGFRGHVVIDHGEYHLIQLSPGEPTRITRHLAQGQKWSVGRNPIKSHPLLGQHVGAPEDVARLAMALQDDIGDRIIVITTSNNPEDQTVRSIVAWPAQLLTEQSTRPASLAAHALLRRQASESGGGWLFALVPKATQVRQIPRLFQDVVVAGRWQSELEAGRYVPLSRSVRDYLGREQPTSRLVREEADQYGEPFYSALTRATEGAKRERGTAAEWTGTLKNMPGVKREELEYTGLESWLAGRGRVSKTEVLDYLRAHEIHIQEVVHGAPAEATADGLAKRKEIFDRWQPEIDRLRAALDALPARNDNARATANYAVLEAESKRDIEADEAYALPEGTEPKFGQYTLPGGRHYRELLLTLPAQPVERIRYGRITPLPNGLYRVSSPGLQDSLHPTEAEAEHEVEQLTQQFGPVKHDPNFRSLHWREPNVLAHVRFDERRDTEGRKVLHLAEIQSDWHQKGRKVGYRESLGPLTFDHLEDTPHQWHVFARQPDGTVAQAFAIGKGVESTEAGAREYAARYLAVINTERARQDAEKVPAAPFKTTWPELAMKRMLRFAAEHGYDRLTWDTGDTNADRYDLSHQISELKAFRFVTPDGVRKYFLKARYPEGGEVPGFSNAIAESDLPDVVGKDLAEKIASQSEDERSYSGLDLKVGGAGMRAFYDQMLPSIVGKLVKRFGSAVGKGAVSSVYANGDPVPVHGVDITPELGAHVMRGQAVFEQRTEYGAEGTPEDDQPAKPAEQASDELARRPIAAVPRVKFLKDLQRLLDPANVSEEPKQTAAIARQSLGELAQATHAAMEQLDTYSKQFDLLSPKDRLDFIDAMETGAPAPFAPGAAQAIRQLLDGWRDRLRSLGVGALDNFIENYFPHMWADPKQAKRVFAEVFGRRSMNGPATFLKQRMIPTVKEGVALGLRPLTTNPLTLTLAKVREMQRFYTGVKLMQRLRDAGLAVFLPAHKPMPEGWAEIKDAVGRVRQWSEAEGGFIERGRYIMPADAALVINNHLSSSWLARFAPVQLVRSVSNAVNALQLGFSAFHLGFTTLDAVISKNALAVERLLHGEPIGALRAFMEAVTGPGAALANVRRGAKLLEAYSDIAGATPEMRRIVEGLMAAGGRVKMDNYFQAARGVNPFRGVGLRSLSQDIRAALTQPHHRVADLAKTVGSFPGQYALHLWRDLQSMAVEMPAWRLPLEIAGRVTRASSAWIMEHIVPLQKLGVFADMAADHIQRHPSEQPEEFARAMQSIWNSVDNRLGELVYDNLFWHRTWQDLTHLGVRAVGWNLGTIREIGGAPVDAARLIAHLARGAPAEGAEPEDTAAEGAAGDAQLKAERAKWNRIADQVGHRIPYVIAMTATVGMLGAMLQYLLTGEGPKELKDYFFPRTGRLNPDGSPERMSLPAYVKDIYEYGRQPGKTLANKANPLIGLVYDIWSNRDYYGDAIRNRDASLWEQVIESARYAAREVLPFSIQGARKFQGAGETGARGKALQAAPFVGVTPAPAIVTNPEQGERYDREHDQEAYLRGLTQQLRQAQRQHDLERVRALRQEIQQERLRLRETEREIRRQRAQAAADRISAIIHGKGRVQAVRALRAAGYPAFAQLWGSMPAQLPERVATALRTFV